VYGGSSSEACERRYNSPRDGIRSTGETAMIRWAVKHVSYANVTATVALVVALGGSSYAALQLPRNSVGTRQLRPGAVRSEDVRNRTLRTIDFSRSARAALAGPMGPAGPQGPPGPAAAKFAAAVASTGRLVRGNATSGGSAGTTGSYVIGFSESVSSCVYTATLGSTDNSSVVAGRVTVRDEGGRVGVQTYDAGGAPADLPFHLLVSC
jgi:hypothetical protein